jgi:cytochrome c-type biogenesis protein CcmH/NrfG
MNGRPGRSRRGGEEGASRPHARAAQKARLDDARRSDPHGLAGRIAELRRRDSADPAGRWFLPLAGALSDAGRPGEAVQGLRQGLARDPECLGGWVLLGQCYAALEEWAAARRVFEVVIGRDRENAVALRGLAAIHARLGDRGQAAAYCRALLRLMPRDLPG